MNGKMKSFVEDTIISVVVIAIISVVYYFISNSMLNEKEIVPEQNAASTTINHQVEEPLVNIQPEDSNQTQSQEEVKIETTPEEKLILENTEKKVDIQKLKQFIATTENNIADNINYNLDTNTTTENEYLKIRITLLKSGDYEQLTFVDGNEKLFEHNKENITKIFPLSIDKDIIEEFPRYLRIELRKKF